MKGNWLTCILVLVSVVVFLGCSEADEEQTSFPKAPDFTLETLNGGEVTLSEVLAEKKVVLIFWTSWCSYCVEKIPQENKFYLEHKDDVEVIGINLREREGRLAVFVEKTGILYPVALDKDGIVAKLYNVLAIPRVIAVDQEGNIVYSGNSINEVEF